MRRHPFISGLILLFLIGLFFFLSLDRCSFIGKERRSLSLKDKVGVVTIDGIIADSQDTVSQLEEFGDDDTIKAVVLRIDSPGGSVAPSQEIYSAVLDLKKKKKVVVSMASICASGGYLIACGADRIVANPGTITGSVSAVMHFVNVEDLLKKIGLKTGVVKSGKFKDIGSPVREMTPEEKALLQGMVDDIYDQFLEIVAKGRGMRKEDVKAISEGRIYTGRQALKLGLVDYNGDLNYAVRLAGEMSGIKGKPGVVFPEETKLTLWDLLMRNMAEEMASTVMETITEKQRKMSGVMYLYDGADGAR
ncbi:MAG: signal peptide peptidase SppA [Smithellaceae bacterium]|nr:signal peptide peptidase SppA [Smithellaceae bacterium]